MKKLLIFLVSITALVTTTYLASSDLQRWTDELLDIDQDKHVVYKWTNNKGIMYVTPKKPPPQISYIVQKVIPNAKILPMAE